LTTGPTAALIPSPIVPLWPDGAGESEYLVHFTGPPANRLSQRRVPDCIRLLKPEERLDRILTGGALRGFPPVEGPDLWPVVSLSEGSPSHVGCMISQG